MSIYSYFFNAVKDESGNYDREYTAEDFTNYLNNLVSDGVFLNPSNNLQVVASNGMNIVVKQGEAWAKGHKMVNDADLILNVQTADVALNRIDRVIFFVDHTNRNMGIKIKKGSNATNPTAPSLQRDETVYEYSLATVTVNKQATSINQSNIRDTRADSTVCGWVTGLVDKVDTSALFLQWQNALDNYLNNSQTSFDNWFNNVRETLNTVVPLKQFKTCYTTVTENEYEFNINIPQLNSVLDILEVYINGFRLNEEEYTVNDLKNVILAKPLDVVGTKVEFVVFKNTDSEGIKRSTTVMLDTAQWNLLTDNYYQNVTVEGVTANSILIISPAPLSVENYGSFSVVALEQSNNTVRFRAKARPTTNLNVQILNLGE